MNKKVCEDQCKMKIPEEFNAVKQGLPLTNRVRGPYRQLRTEFFPVRLWPKREARGP